MISNDEYAAMNNLDLDPIKVKLMHKESGEGWSVSKVNAVEKEYRRFLYLMKAFPQEPTAPVEEVDIFWHYHILDTVKYAADCDQLFGYFLHHFPYVGMRGDDDAAALVRMGDRMRDLYEETFGEKYGSALQSESTMNAAYCGSVGVQPAYCGTVGAKAAYCGTVGVKAAYCGTVGAKAAYCGTVGVKAAYCGTVGVKAAYCGTVGAKAAYCGTVGAKAAYCGTVGAKAAYCGTVGAKAAYCGTVGAKAADCGTVGAKPAYCGTDVRTPDFDGDEAMLPYAEAKPGFYSERPVFAMA